MGVKSISSESELVKGVYYLKRNIPQRNAHRGHDSVGGPHRCTPVNLESRSYYFELYLLTAIY